MNEKPSSSSSDRKVPVKKNDSDCWNCAGVTFFSSELKKQGKKPICYGVEYKATKPIETDQMEALEKLPTITPNTDMYMFGFTQSSARMQRIGQIPVLQYGVKLVVSKKDEVIDKPKPHTTDNSTNTPPSILPTRAVTPPTNIVQRMGERMVSSQFWESYWKSVQKLWRGMQKQGGESVDHLPERFEKSARKLGQSCQRTAGKIWDRIAQKLFGPESGPGPESK